MSYVINGRKDIENFIAKNSLCLYILTLSLTTRYMKKIYFSITAIFLSFISCLTSQEEKYVYISHKSVQQLTGMIVLSSTDNTNTFYDLTITPHYIALLDFHNDTILKVFSLDNFSNPIGFSLKGNGPDDLIFPFFNQNQKEKDELTLVDLNTWSINNINLLHQKKELLTVHKTPLPTDISPLKEANILSNHIIANDVDIFNKRLFFIHNTNLNKTINIPYYPCVRGEYKEDNLPFLYSNTLVTNEDSKSICIAMKKINLIQFYDFKGIKQKSIIIGNQLLYPKYDSNFLDFPKAPNYITDIYSTSKHIYCLYQGTKTDTSTIFLFDWNGKHIKTFQTDKILTKIAVSTDNKYIIGLSLTSEGGTDIIRYALHPSL